jgi:hypothetical protein
MLKTLGIVWHFLVHVVVGVVICHAVAYLLFAIDVICICFFVLVQGGKLLKEIWEDRGFWL